MVFKNIKNLVVPSSLPISGFRKGASIHITGIPFIGTDQYFCIELFAGHDVALSINAIFSPTEKNLVLKSTINGIVQQEEELLNPFKMGSPFKMKIKHSKKCLKIKVNHKRIHSYSHRLPASTISNISVRGDIKIESISFSYFKKSPSGSSHDFLETRREIMVSNIEGPPPAYEESTSQNHEMPTPAVVSVQTLDNNEKKPPVVIY
jgi:hypothetical protein